METKDISQIIKKLNYHFLELPEQQKTEYILIALHKKITNTCFNCLRTIEEILTFLMRDFVS